jgi:hypothetical protein
MTMSQEAFVANKGLTCPNCDSGNISCDQPEIVFDTVYAIAECRDCRAEWTEKYGLIGYTDLRVPDTKSTHAP